VDPDAPGQRSGAQPLHPVGLQVDARGTSLPTYADALLLNVPFLAERRRRSRHFHQQHFGASGASQLAGHAVLFGHQVCRDRTAGGMETRGKCYDVEFLL